MSDSFNVTVTEVRKHSDTVQQIAAVVGAARAAAAPSVGDGAYGLVGQFFAAAITAAAGSVLDGIKTAAQSVDDVRTGLRDTAADYERIDRVHARAFTTSDTSGAQNGAQL